CSTPSMRKRTMPLSRRGSTWMSLARCSKAYCHSQSTMRTTCASLASSVLFSLPSSTSCSKFESPLAPVVLLPAPLIDVERIRDHALDVALDDAGELGFPFAHERLGRRNGRFLGADADRQDAKARR